MTGRLYNNVAALYSGFFRTSKVLDDLNDAGNKVNVLDPELRNAFRYAWEAHVRFCESTPDLGHTKGDLTDQFQTMSSTNYLREYLPATRLFKG